MNRALLEKHLVRAEQHVAQSERHVRRQQELIEPLAAYGQDTTEAEDLLEEFERGLALHSDGRDQILAQLVKPTH